MKTTTQYLDDVKIKLGISSDYALAKALGVAKQTVSRWSQGKGYFDDDIAIRVAEILGVHPAIILSETHAERSKNPIVQAVWFGMMEKFSASFNALLSGCGPRDRRLVAR